jgi:hypothetical protein
LKMRKWLIFFTNRSTRDSLTSIMEGSLHHFTYKRIEIYF